MVKKCAILQSNYIPWKGYFDLVNSVDELIIYDSVSYTKRDWRNRNRIKTPHGLLWLTIPVSHANNSSIDEIRVKGADWADDHLGSLFMSYSRAPFFPEYKEFLADLYRRNKRQSKLTEINLSFLTAICELLNIRTTITRDRDYELKGDRVERLLNLCKQAGAGIYLSGPTAKSYLDVDFFFDNGIQVEWMDYHDYPEYTQVHEPFDHSVSVLDLILCTGENAPSFMKSFNLQASKAGPALQQITGNRAP